MKTPVTEPIRSEHAHLLEHVEHIRLTAGASEFANPTRCLLALEDPAAEQTLRQAAELFNSMGYRPALAETEAVIAQTTALAS